MTRRFPSSNCIAPSLRVMSHYYDQAVVRSEPDLTYKRRTGNHGRASDRKCR
jgi:hypothetical protein